MGEKTLVRVSRKIAEVKNILYLYLLTCPRLKFGRKFVNDPDYAVSYISVTKYSYLHN